MSQKRVDLPQNPAPLIVEPGAIYSIEQMQREVDENKKLMLYVVLVLLVMVAGMLHNALLVG